MNELDAALCAAADAEHDIALCARALSPEDIEACVATRALARIRHLDYDRVGDLAYKAMGERMPSASTTLAIASILTIPLRASIVPSLEPEDARAYIRWAVGSHESGEGYGQRMIRSVADTHTESALQNLLQPFLDMHQRMVDADQRLYGHFMRQLPRQAQRLIQGMFLEARWASIDRDGETAREIYIRTRKATRHFVAMNANSLVIKDKL
jgi:hypothetical protein